MIVPCIEHRRLDFDGWNQKHWPCLASRQLCCADFFSHQGWLAKACIYSCSVHQGTPSVKAFCASESMYLLLFRMLQDTGVELSNMEEARTIGLKQERSCGVFFGCGRWD